MCLTVGKLKFEPEAPSEEDDNSLPRGTFIGYRDEDASNSDLDEGSSDVVDETGGFYDPNEIVEDRLLRVECSPIEVGRNDIKIGARYTSQAEEVTQADVGDMVCTVPSPGMAGRKYR